MDKLDTDMKPQVSVIIPAYNASQYLRETIASVLAQKSPCKEIIIVDDGSRDETWAIACELANKDQRIRAVTQKNGGVSSARNHGFRMSKGEFVAFLDSDDLWHPDFLSKAIEAFAGGSDVFVAASHRFHKVMGDCSDFHGPDEYFVSHFPNSLIKGNPIVPAMVVMRRKAIETVGAFEDDRGAWEDWDYWIRLAEHGFRFAFDTTGHLVHYRSAPNSRSSAVAMGHERCAGTLEKHEFTSIAPRKLLRSERANWMRRRGNVEFDSGLARSFYWKSLQLSPFDARTWVKWFLSWMSAHRA